MTDTQALAMVMAILLSSGMRYEEAMNRAREIAREAGLEECQCSIKRSA